MKKGDKLSDEARAKISASLIGNTRSLGREPVNKTHGASRSPTYRSWESMKRRCYNERATNYMYYGALGVRVCERWRESFEAFLADMGERPEGFVLSRMGDAGNYQPDNCRWISHAQNSHESTRGPDLKPRKPYRLRHPS